MARKGHVSEGGEDVDEKALGLRIGQAMEWRGFDQAGLAVELGTNQETISRWVTGKRIPSGPYLIALVRKLNVSPAWLLLGEGEMDPIASTEAQTKMRLIRAILETRITEPAEGGREWVEEVLESYDHQPPPAETPRRAGGGGGST